MPNPTFMLSNGRQYQPRRGAAPTCRSGLSHLRRSQSITSSCWHLTPSFSGRFPVRCRPRERSFTVCDMPSLIRLDSLIHEVQPLVGTLRALLSESSAPDPVLIKHCPECEFETYCRKRVTEKDDLSLLDSLSIKDRTTLNTKGIFTVTQFAYTFRPRRRPKRLASRKEKYHHALKALAIRLCTRIWINVHSRRLSGKRRIRSWWLPSAGHSAAGNRDRGNPDHGVTPP